MVRTAIVTVVLVGALAAPLPAQLSRDERDELREFSDGPRPHRASTGAYHDRHHGRSTRFNHARQPGGQGPPAAEGARGSDQDRGERRDEAPEDADPVRAVSLDYSYTWLDDESGGESGLSTIGYQFDLDPVPQTGAATVRSWAVEVGAAGFGRDADSMEVLLSVGRGVSRYRSGRPQREDRWTFVSAVAGDGYGLGELGDPDGVTVRHASITRGVLIGLDAGRALSGSITVPVTLGATTVDVADVTEYDRAVTTTTSLDLPIGTAWTVRASRRVLLNLGLAATIRPLERAVFRALLDDGPGPDQRSRDVEVGWGGVPFAQLDVSVSVYATDRFGLQVGGRGTSYSLDSFGVGAYAAVAY